jgi:hypothetical protein
MFSLFLISHSGNAQIKISDKKSNAFKESRKNKNKKRKKRQKRYRDASIQNQTSGELEVVPEALQERYVPKKQNAEKNPSRSYTQSDRKQRRNYTKKANESQKQGMVIKDNYQRRQKRYRKQSKSIVQHQGNIRVEPYVLRSRQGFFPQPPVDDTPGRTNVRKRNQKLAQYSQKSEEALMQGLTKSKSRKQIQAGTLEKSIIAQSQGLYRVKSKRKQDKQIQRNSNKAALNTGNLSASKNRKEDTYMAKSVEGMNQGMTVKSKKVRDRKQIMQFNSMAQSRFSGNQKFNTKNREDQYMIKSIEAQNQGLVIKNKSLRDRKQVMQSNSMAQSQFQGNLKYNAKNREDQYMIKSIEAQNQGLVIKNKSLRDRKQVMQSNSMAQSQFQGNLKYNAKNREDQYMIKSIEAQNQGLVIKNKSLRDRKQVMQSNSMAQSQFQGNLKFNTSKRDDLYMAKSIEAQQQGLTIKNKSLRDRKQLMQSNSMAQSQFQGNLKFNTSKRDDLYMAKSIEAQQQGLTIKNRSLRDRKQLMQSNSMAQSQFQGNLKFNTRKRDDLYMAKSIEAQQQGLTIKNRSLRDRKQLMQSNSMAQSQYQGNLNLNKLQKDDIYMAKSVEMQSAGLTIRRSDRKKEAMYIRKSIEASNVGLYKVRGDISKEDIYMGKSVEMMNQGLYKGQSIQDRESQYIRKSIEMLNAGLFKTKSKSAKESQLKQKSNEVMSYSGDLKYISERKRDASLKKASADIYAYKGDFKVQRRLFERIHYKRLSTKHRKFDGMDEESRFEHWWASLWKRPMDQKKKPEPLRKPRYDSKEHEIWFD